MKLPLRSSYLKTILLIAPLGLHFCGLATIRAGSGDLPFPGRARLGSEYRDESPQGYLTVYSVTDQFDDGGVLYYAHSSYSIYKPDGKFFKNVENHISRSDEIPALVTLPAGSYMIETRSESRGYVRVLIVINPGRRTVLDPNKGQTDTGERFS